MSFATQLNDCILVYVIQKYLLREEEGFYVTDIGTAPCYAASTLASILSFLIESLRDSVEHDVAVTNSTSRAKVQERSDQPTTAPVLVALSLPRCLVLDDVSIIL